MAEWLRAPGSEAIAHAWHLLTHESGPVLISGAAGTGKSHLISLYLQESEARVVVLASTGVAALRIGGQTVHSYFRLPPRVITKPENVPPERLRVYAAADVILIDEVSMLGADAIDAIDYLLRRARGSHLPFGGTRIIFVGDPYQLAPVVTPPDAAVLKHLGYASRWFFEARVLRECPLRVALLDIVHRQTEREFVDVLSRVRIGRITAADLALLNARTGATAITMQPSASLKLTSRRAAAEQDNLQRLNQIPGQEVLLNGTIEGVFPHRELPVPLLLPMKGMARVMFIRNDPDRRWVNGTMGTLLAFQDDDSLLVQIDSSRGDPCVVRRVTWEHLQHTYNRAARRVEVAVRGTYQQFPVVLGWAATIHKTQGVSLDRVRIDLGHGAFAAGQTYVGLSRVRSLAGLELMRVVTMEDIWTDPLVSKFMRKAEGTGRHHDAA
jgi:hypothetical protein